jgi:hypothetical protein
VSNALGKSTKIHLTCSECSNIEATLRKTNVNAAVMLPIGRKANWSQSIGISACKERDAIQQIIAQKLRII